MLMLCPCLIFAGREFQILTPLNIIDCCVIDLEKKARRNELLLRVGIV